MAAGTRAHGLLEGAVNDRTLSVLDWENEPGIDGVELTRDDVEAVQVALDYVNGLLDRHPDAIFWVELKATLSEDVGGSADIVIYVPSLTTLHVIDYKHGRGKFVSEDTPQTKFYATCALFCLPDLAVSRVDATIIQPRCVTGSPIRTAVYSPADLLGFDGEIEDAVAAARQPDAPLVAGELQCHWCPAAAVCPALHAQTLTVSDAAWSAAVDGSEDRTILSFPSASAMRADPAALADTLAALPVLQSWIDAVEAEAKALAVAGVHLPGFKLVQKRATRKWADEAAVRNWFVTTALGSEDIYAPRKLLSVARAEKLVNKTRVKELAAFVVKESSGVNLVPESAAGDAVNPSQTLTAGVPLPEII